MKITVVGRKCVIRDSFIQRAEKRLEKIEKFFSSDTEAKVTATVEKSEQKVEVTIYHDGMIFRSQERAINMNEALDSCVDSLVRQIRKNKTKVEKRLKQEAFEAYDRFDSYESDDDEYMLERTKSLVLKPQSLDEAILQMNLLDHQFYLFLDSDTGKIGTIYKRSSGGYGLLTVENSWFLVFDF